MKLPKFGKKTLLLVGLVIIGGVFVWVVSRPQTQTKNQNGNRVNGSPIIPHAFTSPLPEPRFPIQFPKPNIPQHDVSGVVSALPQKIPLIEVSPPSNTQIEANRLALVFGFTGAPQEQKLNTGSLYTWNRGERTSLVLGGDPLEITYNTPVVDPNIPLQFSDEEYELAAQNYFKKYSLIPTNTILSNPTVEYFISELTHIDSAADRSKATRVRISYQLLVNGLPVYARDPNQASFSIDIAGNKDLIMLSAIYFQQITVTDTGVELIPFAEAQQRIEANVNVLFSNQFTGDTFGSDAQPRQIKYTKIYALTPGYYYTPSQTTLTPIYALYGKGATANNEETTTTTLVSAIK